MCNCHDPGSFDKVFLSSFVLVSILYSGWLVFIQVYLFILSLFYVLVSCLFRLPLCLCLLCVFCLCVSLCLVFLSCCQVPPPCVHSMSPLSGMFTHVSPAHQLSLALPCPLSLARPLSCVFSTSLLPLQS